MLTPEQIVASNKANLNNLFGLTNQAFAGVEKLVELNLTAARASLAESADHAKAVLSVKDAQELLALQASYLQPLAEKAAAYNRHVYDITSGTSAALGKAVEAKAAEGQQAFLGYVDAALKNAPAVSVTVCRLLSANSAACLTAFCTVSTALLLAATACLKKATAWSEPAGAFFKAAST